MSSRSEILWEVDATRLGNVTPRFEDRGRVTQAYFVVRTEKHIIYEIHPLRMEDDIVSLEFPGLGIIHKCYLVPSTYRIAILRGLQWSNCGD